MKLYKNIKPVKKLVLRRVSSPSSSLRSKEVANKEQAIKARIAARDRYREKHNVTMISCSNNFAELERNVKVRLVQDMDGKSREIPFIAVTALGPVLEVTGVTVLRWVERGMLPAPIFQAAKGQGYHLEEVRSFVQIIGDHQLETRQYRQAHVETKLRLFQQNARIRRGLL